MGKMKWGRQATFNNRFFCTKCGREGIPLSRKSSKGREAGHLKKLYCFNCRQEVNHIEIKEWTHYDFNDFAAEFYGDNFDTNGKRKLEIGEFKKKINSQYKQGYSAYTQVCAELLKKEYKNGKN